MPSVQIIRIIRIGVLFVTAFIFFHPHDIRARHHLDVLRLNPFPSVITIGNDLVHAIRLHIFHHVPLHIFLDDGAVRIRIFRTFLVHTRTEEFSPAFHRIAKRIVILEWRTSYDTVFYRDGFCYLCHFIVVFLAAANCNCKGNE